eukprot:scaffold66993_cov42-Attheya_sp.AAC.2
MAYMGTSPRHASNSPLALDPETGAVRQQWNVVFDDWFATVASTSLPDFNNTDEHPETPPPRLALEDARQDAVVTAIERAYPTQPLPVVPPPTAPPASSQALPPPLANPPPSGFERETSVSSPSLSTELPALWQRETAPRVAEPPKEAVVSPSMPSPLSPPVIRQSRHQRRTPQYLRDEQALVARVNDEHACVARRLSFDDESDDDFDENQMYAFYSFMMDNDHLIQVYATRAVTDPDTFTYEQAMADTDEREEWKTAAQNEITQLVENHTWKEVPLTSA